MNQNSPETCNDLNNESRQLKQNMDTSYSDKDSNSNVKFKAAYICLPTMIDEYTKERERGSILDNKALALITILLALITVYLPLIPFSKIKKIYNTGKNSEITLLVTLLFCFIAAIIVTIISFCILIVIYRLKTYHRVDLQIITNKKYLLKNDDIYQQALCEHYKELTLHNSSVNDKKAKKLNLAFILTIISFILLLITCIGLKLL